MEFELSEDQREIQRTARDLLAERATFEKVRAAALEHDGRDEGLWRELAELGWPGIAVAEEHGGQGLGMVELAVLAEELGYALAPVPFLGTALAALAIEHAGSDEQRAEWLPRLAAGEVTGALSDGGAELVPDGAGAAVAVVGDAVVAGALERVQSIDPTRTYGTAAGATGAPLPGDRAAAFDRAAVVVGAELVGVCRRALEMTVAYVKDRQQFGVPVGAFQAVQHTAAKMLRDTEGARALTYFAAWAADAEPERLPEAAAMAKAATASAGRSVTADAIQLHGGIGFTWEADVHWLFKRAQLVSVYLGGAGRHRARVAELVAGQRAAAADGAGPKRRTAPAPEQIMAAGS
jgi:alkylation response protein AidB-like acyl-CoA dehydrogenase